LSKVGNANGGYITLNLTIFMCYTTVQ
jgi:hypothetical protein